MRPYEVMIILDPSLEEGAIRDQVDRSTELIRNGGGTPGRVDRWGRRRLAYEIRHQREGYYVVVEAMADPAAMAALDRALRLSDEVLRHKVIRLPDRIAGQAPRPAPPAPEPSTPAATGFAADEAASDTSINANGA
jgi:small subunit ribosomal protein S6